MADISEYQPNFDARAYIASGHSCIIIRAHNGWRPDRMFPGRRDYVRQYPFTAVGYYQYLVAGRDAAQQARDLLATIGPLRGNEFLINDHEEGSGDQTGRAQAWFNVVDSAIGFKGTLYAGQYFGRDHLSGWGHWAGRPRWIAAYGAAEPRDPHEFWQYSDAGHFAGLPGGVDSSVYHGTEQQFISMARGGHAAPPSMPTPPEDTVAIAATQNHDGRLAVFVELKDGQVKHCEQDKPGGEWWKKADGTYNWLSLGNPSK
jgi:GH25 family lysozyme M1 (1,4-beta-N-acetylmuramidase)